MTKFKNSTAQINDTDGGLLPSHVFCVDWALKSQDDCLLFHLRYKSLNGLSAISNLRRTLGWWSFIRRRYNCLLITEAE